MGCNKLATNSTTHKIQLTYQQALRFRDKPYSLQIELFIYSSMCHYGYRRRGGIQKKADARKLAAVMESRISTVHCSLLCISGKNQLASLAYETHSAVQWPNAVLCKRMCNATDKRKIDNGCMQKHKREEGRIIFAVRILGLGLGK